MRLLKLVPDTTNIEFLKWRNVAIILSMILTIGAITLTATRGLNLGVDFAGGQMIQVTFTQDEEAPVQSLREEIGQLGVGDPLARDRERGRGCRYRQFDLGADHPDDRGRI
jgi:preprotein translocase subunit SecF